MLKEIKIERLYSHPQNLRKDIGDITELTESIKNQGIFQNLTVIEGGAGVPEGVDGYTVIIGHRRLAAAKRAGLESLPCSVAVMDEKEQIATMLLENMQRSDLTYYEQAQGFQMMLDLGETQTSIAEKTGFSPATVSRRLQLTKLDQDKLKEVTSARQISLNDLEALNKIESVEKRNELLDKIGTSNFEWLVKSAIDSENAKKKADAWHKVLVSAGLTEIENRWDSKYSHCKRSWISTDANPDEYVKAEDEKYFEIEYGNVYFRKDGPKTAENTAAADKARKEAEALNSRREQLKSVSRNAYELRSEFISNVSNAVAKAHLVDIIAFHLYSSAMWGGCYVEEDDVMSLLNLEWKFDKEENSFVEFNSVAEVVKKSPEKLLLLMIYKATGDGAEARYFEYWELRHQYNEELSALYDFLCKLGYRMSDEEIQLRDGTHSLFNE